MRVPFHAGHTLGLGAALILPIGLYAVRGIAPLAVLVTLLTAATWLNRRPDNITLRNGLVCAALALPVWALISAIWSITPGVTIKTGISFFATMVAGVVMISTARNMTGSERSTFLSILIWGGAFGFALMAIDLFLDGLLYRPFMAAKGKAITRPEEIKIFLNPGTTVAAIFSWTWIAALWTRGHHAICVVALSIIVATVLQAQAQTPVSGLLVGLVALAVAVFFRKLAAKIMGTCVVVAILAMPFAIAMIPPIEKVVYGMPWLSPSLTHRVTIWQTAHMHWLDSPILGLGFDTTRSLYGKEDAIDFSFYADDGTRLMDSRIEPIPLHPHNGFLQTWLELGGIAAAILATIVWNLFQSASRSNVLAFRVMGFAQLSTAISIAAVAFGAWQSWWLCSLLLMCALTTAVIRSSVDEQEQV